MEIMIFDGVVRTLCNVGHVPDLRRSLISVGTLRSLGLKFVIEKYLLKIVYGSLIAMK